jgi:hypothetical protein
MISGTDGFAIAILGRVFRVLAIIVVAWSSGVDPVRAQDLLPGDTAIVSAEGDGLLLRDGPGYEANPVALYPDSSTVVIVDGPIWAADGSAWYLVEIEGQTGYMVSHWLVLAAVNDGAAPASLGIYRAGPDCGPDETWLLETARRLDTAVEAWLWLGDAVAAGAWGFDLDVYQGTFAALRDEQQATVAPPAGQRLQDALVALFDGLAGAVVQIKMPGLLNSSVGMDFDEPGAYQRLSNGELPPLDEEAQAAIFEFVAACSVVAEA